MQEPLPLILWRPDITSPLCGWSWYGAHQLLELAGVPFSEWEAVSIPDEILEKAKVLLMPNTARPKPVVEIVRRALAFGKVVVVGCETALTLLQDGVDIGARPKLPLPLPPTEPSELLPLRAYALLPPAFTEVTLPLLGEPVLFVSERPALGTMQTTEGQQGALAWVQPIGEGTLLVVAGRIWETCGLLLSRFSWFAHPHRRDSFLHRVDPLWDEQLTAWHRFPVVSFYARFLAWLLCAVLRERNELLCLRWCLPHQDGMPFRMALTALHDVEVVFDDPGRKRAENPNYCFAQWLDLEERLQVRSAFFFLSPVTALPPHWRLNYDVTDEPVQAALDMIEERGSEIGLLSIAHASESALAMERERLEDFGGVFLWGVRNYRFGNTPASVRHKSVVGFAYDASWFAGQNEPSFLTGCAYPFRPLDAERWQVLPLVELSAILDDRVLFGDLTGAQRDGDASQQGILFGETVLAMNGVLCLSFQQHTFAQRGSAFELVVRHCQEVSGGAIWFPAPREVAEWWTWRNEVRIKARLVGRRWFRVEVALPEGFDEALAFVLVIPVAGNIRVVCEGAMVSVHRLAPLGSLTLWGVPLVLLPDEPIVLSVGIL